MAQKSLFNSESAAFTAIAAVLLLGLAFTVISVVKLNYVPEWKIDAERDYSYDAWSDMEEVKTRGDIFARFMDSDNNYPRGLSATVPFGMGGGEIPVFEPSKSNGKLTVNTEECRMIITFGNHTYPVDCGGITYYSENRQYPDQVFRYENGALILAQGENSQMKRAPLFNVTEDLKNYTVTINAIGLTGEPASISANSFTALRLTGNRSYALLNSEDYKEAGEPIDSFNLTIYTKYTDAWATYLNNTVKKELEYGNNYTIKSTDDYVCLSFLPPGDETYYDIYFNKTELYAELGGVLAGEATQSGGVMELGTWYYFDTFTGIYDGISLSPSPDPTLLRDYNSSQSLPAGNSPGVEVTLYIPENDFAKQIDEQKNLQLTFTFNSYTKFESSPSKATILMIYKYDKLGVSEPEMETSFEGMSYDTITKIPPDNWMVYNNTFSISPISPSDLKFNLEVIPGNNEHGTFHIDYLAVRLE